MFGMRGLKSGDFGTELDLVQPLRQGRTQHAGVIGRLMEPATVERVSGKWAFAFASDHQHTAHALTSAAAEKMIEGAMRLILPHPVQIEPGLGVDLTTRKALAGSPIQSLQRGR